MITFTNDEMVKRLRWVMAGVMLFSMVITLCGQPESFWRHAETAMRGDGLSINNKINHTFEFFIDQGWEAYAVASLVYISAAFLLVSILPRVAALIVIFSFILGHYFGASNWLAIRWHMGVQGPLFYNFVLVPIIVFSALPVSGANADRIVRSLRWVMIGPLLFDMVVTLVGQPASYWAHPETVHEANQLSRFFLMQGLYAYLAEQLIYTAGAFWLASVLPRTWGLVCILCFIFGGFIGGSCWLFFEWRLGMEAPVIYGIILSIIIVLVAFNTGLNKRQKFNTKFDPAVIRG